MKEKLLSFLLPILFVVFIPSTAWSQNPEINQETLGIVKRCNKIVMTGYKKYSRGKKIDNNMTDEEREKIEFNYVPGSNGHIMLFVRDKNNPKSAAKNNIGFIGKNSDVRAKPEYKDGQLSYYFANIPAETIMMVTCEKGKFTRSVYYLNISYKQNDDFISDIHLITRVEFYERGAASPSLTVFLPTEDYCVNLFKFFWEKMLENYQ